VGAGGTDCTHARLAQVAAWSCLFQVNRCLLQGRLQGDSNLAASALVTAPLFLLPEVRRRLPWILALTAMDWYHGGLGQRPREI
jgi:hypothetical protein